jgi:hypothetical protein
MEFTLAMSIGKFNFANLRQANSMAAWIFFVFSSKLYFNFESFEKENIVGKC